MTSCRYYVYSHHLKGELLYIGMGNERRPFDLKSGSRTYLWNKFVGKNWRKVEVVVIEAFDDKASAMALEKRLIKEQLPKANTFGHPINQAKMIRKRERFPRLSDYLQWRMTK